MTLTTDRKLKIKIARKLHCDERIDAGDISVTVADGRTTLRGQVTSYRAKRIAEDDAKEVEGIAVIDNQLQVYYPS